jgi:hypothetical protein
MKKDTQKKYTDIDYDAFPLPDLDLDIHWILLPIAVWREKQKAREAALHAQQIAEQPEDHKVILVPADATYAPKEPELWPIINHAVLEAIKPHKEMRRIVWEAVKNAMDDHRGWRNPYPVSLDYPEKPIATQAK